MQETGDRPRRDKTAAADKTAQKKPHIIFSDFRSIFHLKNGS
jgi:hypothetical protein